MGLISRVSSRTYRTRELKCSLKPKIMHIKYITLQGFKSYKNAIKTDLLSPHHNIVVGRNGSGKSNFFAAIQFVLSEEFCRLSPEQRQGLIYEGAGASRIMSAYVEIIFDNSDHRLLVSDKEEVALRRAIGSKKDQFFLDGKVVTRNDVMNLLESAGFSRSNPYYIVRQGKINEIATAKESERLKLLKEVAGTRVYDERKKEAAQLMSESDAKITSSNELLEMIDEKLKTLEHEKAELVEYQKLDKRKKALEYSITDTELHDIKRKLEALSKKRSDEVSHAAIYRQGRHEAEVESRKFESELHEHTRKLSQLIEEERQCSKEKSSIVRSKQQLDLEVWDFRNQQDQDTVNRDNMRKELEILQEKIEIKSNKLQELTPEFNETKTNENKVQTTLNRLTVTKDEINARRGRKALFSTRAQRDKYLEKQLNSIEKEISNKSDDIRYCEEQVKKDENLVLEIDEKYDKIVHEKSTHNRNWESQHNELTLLKRGREQQYSSNYEIVREETNAFNDIEAYRQNIQNKKNRLNNIIGRSTYNAIQSLNTVKEHFRKRKMQDLVDGYYGMVIDYISCDEEFYTCTEAAAGSKFFNFVMKDVRVAKAYIQEMNKMDLPGTPITLPLNTLSNLDYNYPEIYDENGEITAFPLIERMNVSRKDFIPVAKHLVGRYMVTVDSQWSDKISREYNLSCVTLAGDTTSSRGVISGGYRDLSKSRLRLYQEIHKIDEIKLQELIENYNSLKTKKANMETDTSKLRENISNKEAEVNRYRALIETCIRQEKILKEDKTNKKYNMDSNMKAINHYKDSLIMLNSQKDSMNQEKLSEFNQIGNSLSQSEQNDIIELNHKINLNKKELNILHSKRQKLERNKNAMENELYNNLHKRRDQLIAETDDIKIAERNQQLGTCQADLETATKELEYVETRLHSLINELNSAREEEIELKTKFEEATTKEKEFAHKLDEDQKKFVKISTKQQTFSQKKDELERKINDIGPVAQEIVAKFRGAAVKNLYSKLHDANTSLQKYSHVNKKALNQYMASAEERNVLESRRSECLKGKQAIEEMMEILEEKKYTQIMFTFQQVSKHFKDVFMKLVPGGHADLVMKTLPIEEAKENSSQVDLFTGVSIKVSFTGGTETREMTQLSGGQKSLVALTLIFAIQKCDPAPFYLFDEIDAALDPAYRKQVALVIGELSDNAQFISTTFRPELLDSGDMFHGVLYKGKVSDIRTITKEQAMEFVEDDALHG